MEGCFYKVKEQGLEVKRQVAGFGTCCYLIYDLATKDAALIDIGGDIAELLDTVQEEALRIRYILVTHGHPDHVAGMPEVRKILADAEVCMHKYAYIDLQTIGDWIRATKSPEEIKEACRDPEFRKLVELDPASVGEPDRYLDEGDTLQLGGHSISVLHCPGHSRGGLCYAVGDFLFSGDVLFRDSVGRVDGQNSSREDQISSVLRLYGAFPDETIVNPGHGEPTTIGRERNSNQRVNDNEINL
jgi:glyoxylase-like metal-dependent hydrolase (beta-lactamase superfamily II)